jgi:hypothetical protein
LQIVVGLFLGDSPVKTICIYSVYVPLFILRSHNAKLILRCLGNEGKSKKKMKLDASASLYSKLQCYNGKETT